MELDRPARPAAGGRPGASAGHGAADAPAFLDLSDGTVARRSRARRRRRRASAHPAAARGQAESAPAAAGRPRCRPSTVIAEHGRIERRRASRWRRAAAGTGRAARGRVHGTGGARPARLTDRPTRAVPRARRERDRRTERAGTPAAVPHVAGAVAASRLRVGFRAHRDGGLGLRGRGCSSCRASTPRRTPPQARAVGVVNEVLPGDPRHHHRPQRRAAGRVARRPDDRRRPDQDRDDAARDRHDPRTTGSASTTSSGAQPRCASRTPTSATSPAGSRRRRPTRSSRDSTTCGYKGIDTRRDPVRTYPADDVAANLVGFTNAEGQAGEGAELMFDTLLAGKDGSATYDVGWRQPDPAGRQQRRASPRDGDDLDADHRPRRAVVHPARAAPGRRGRRRRVAAPRW